MAKEAEQPFRFGLLVFPGVQQLDLTGPYEVFSSAQGTQVELIWKDKEPVVLSSGLTFFPTRTFDNCLPLCIVQSTRRYFRALARQIISAFRQHDHCRTVKLHYAFAMLVIGGSVMFEH